MRPRRVFSLPLMVVVECFLTIMAIWVSELLSQQQNLMLLVQAGFGGIDTVPTTTSEGIVPSDGGLYVQRIAAETGSNPVFRGYLGTSVTSSIACDNLGDLCWGRSGWYFIRPVWR